MIFMAFWGAAISLVIEEHLVLLIIVLFRCTIITKRVNEAKRKIINKIAKEVSKLCFETLTNGVKSLSIIIPDIKYILSTILDRVKNTADIRRSCATRSFNYFQWML